MTWVKLDDGFPDHPKVLKVGGAAAWLYVSGLCYCGRFLTDGFIPSTALPKLTDAKAPQLLAAKLVEAGMWETAVDGWSVHDYGKYQRTKERVTAQREAASRRQSRKRHGVTDEEVTVTDTDSLSDTDARRVTDALQLLADTDVDNYRLRGGRIDNLRAFRAKCLTTRTTDNRTALCELAAANPDWTIGQLADAVDEPEPAQLHSVPDNCFECGWTLDSEHDHGRMHSDWLAS
jgi:hypothetical protein